MASNPLLEAIRGGRKAKSLYDDDSLYQDSEDGPGLLSRIGQGALSGVSAVGNFLDIPRSVADDLIGGVATGNWNKYNPVDQLAPWNWFTDEHRQTGREVNRDLGLASRQDSTANWWGGFAHELLVDPTTYIGVGALTKAGKATKAAGLLGDAALGTAKLEARIGGSIAKVAKATSKLGVDEGADALKALGTAAKTHGVDLADEGALQSLLHVGIPFTDIGAHIGTGEFAQSIASRIDKLGTAAKGLAPTRALRMLFDPSVKGKFDLAEQAVAETASRNADRALKVGRLASTAYIKDMGEVYSEGRKFFQDATGIAATEPDTLEKSAKRLFDDAVRLTFETEGQDLETTMRYLAPNNKLPVPKELGEKIQALAVRSQRMLDRQAKTVMRKGGRMSLLGSIADDLDPDSIADDLVDAPQGPKSGTPASQPTDDKTFKTGIYAGQSIKSMFEYTGPGAGKTMSGNDILQAQAASGDPWKNVNSWITNNLRPHAERAEKSGLADKIENLAAQRKTAKQIADELGVDKEIVDAVRIQRQIPSWTNAMNMGGNAVESQEFTAWLRNRKAPPPPAGIELLTKASEGPVSPPSATMSGDEILQAQAKGAESATFVPPPSAPSGMDLLTGNDAEKLASPYFPRSLKFASTADKQRHLATQTAAMQHRKNVLRYVPEKVLENLTADPAFRGGDDAAVKAILDSDHAPYIGKNYTPKSSTAAKEAWDGFRDEALNNKLTPEQAIEYANQQFKLDAKKLHATDLAQWIEEKAQGWTYGGNETKDDLFKYAHGMALVEKNLDAFHTIASTQAYDPAKFKELGKAAPGSMNLKTVMKLAGMNTGEGLKHLASITGMDADTLSKMVLDDDMANALIGSQKAINNPIWAGKIAEFFDNMNGAWKRAMILPWISTKVRNAIGGHYLNITASGQIDNAADLAVYGQHVARSVKEATNGVDPGHIERLYVNNVFHPQTVNQDVAAVGASGGGWGMDLTGPANPLRVKQTWAEQADPMKNTIMEGILGKARADKIENIPGIKQASQGYRTVLGTGSKAEQFVEYTNRSSMFTYLTEHKGWSDEAAAAKVNELQFDHTKASPFERDVMKRLVPFYTWNARVAPLLLKTLMAKPGGALAQTIRLENRAHGEDALTPEHVASTLAIPNPWKTPEEGQSYITGFGLPFEQTAQFFGNFPSLREGGREALSQTTPLIKAPLEWASGQSFFQSGSGGAGRPLEELDPTLSRTISNVTGAKLDTPDLLEFAVSNSPLSRIATTARTVTDTRKTAGEKALNLLTGVRVTDVSPAAEDAVLRDRAKEVMRDLGAKTFEKVYFSKEDLAQMDPKQRAEAEKFQALMALLATKAKERKKLVKKN